MDSDSDSSKPPRSWVLPFIFLIAIIGLLVAIAIPNFNHGGSTKLNGIINHLRQIDAAKQEWAIEHGLTNTVQLDRVVTEKDLAPLLLPVYTQHEDFGNPRFGELYLIRNLNQPSEAILTQKLTERYVDSSLPKGAIIRLDSEAEKQSYEGYEIILPDGTSRIYSYLHGTLMITNR
jgi:hypothetical protein